MFFVAVVQEQAEPNLQEVDERVSRKQQPKKRKVAR